MAQVAATNGDMYDNPMCQRHCEFGGSGQRMQIGRDREGRPVTYDESTGRFLVGEFPTTVERLLGYDRTNQIEWVSDEVRSWAYEYASWVRGPRDDDETGVVATVEREPVPAFVPRVDPARNDRTDADRRSSSAVVAMTAVLIPLLALALLFEWGFSALYAVQAPKQTVQFADPQLSAPAPATAERSSQSPASLQLSPVNTGRVQVTVVSSQAKHDLLGNPSLPSGWYVEVILEVINETGQPVTVGERDFGLEDRQSGAAYQPSGDREIGPGANEPLVTKTLMPGDDAYGTIVFRMYALPENIGLTYRKNGSGSPEMQSIFPRKPGLAPGQVGN